MLAKIRLNIVGLPGDDAWTKACWAKYSDYITQKFSNEIKDSQNYHPFIPKAVEVWGGEDNQLEIAVKRKIIKEAVHFLIVEIRGDGHLKHIYVYPCPILEMKGIAATTLFR